MTVQQDRPPYPSTRTCGPAQDEGGWLGAPGLRRPRLVTRVPTATPAKVAFLNLPVCTWPVFTGKFLPERAIPSKARQTESEPGDRLRVDAQHGPLKEALLVGVDQRREAAVVTRVAVHDDED